VSVSGDQRRAYAYAAAAVLLWSTVASAFKLSLRHLRPDELLLWANGVSVVVLGLFVALAGKLGELRRFSRRELLQRAALGLLNPCLYYLVLFRAYDRLPAQEAQPLNYTWAVTLALLSIPLLGQRIGWREIGAMLVSYSGVVVIATRGDLTGLRFESPSGVGLALVSTIIWALFWIYDRRSTRDPLAGLLVSFVASLPVVLLENVIVGWPPGFPSWRGLGGAAYVGAFEMGVTFVLWSRALKLSETTARVGNLIFFSPFLSLVLIHFLVGEEILSSSMVGLGLIVAGNVLQQLAARPRYRK
jgi:drug/metabolite transporter (DMT)-like permease